MTNEEVLDVVKQWLDPNQAGATELSPVQKAQAASEATRLLSISTHPQRGEILGAAEFVQCEVFLSTKE